MMKLASRVIIVAVVTSLLCLGAFAQGDGSRMKENDPRNTAPTVGTGGPVGGPTGLFTVYDGKTLRKWEHTLSFAYSNYDRDPGNMDFAEIPVSFQIGLSNNFEIFYNTDIWRGVKVNSPRNISGTYLPDARTTGSFPAIVLAPDGGGTNLYRGLAVYRPTGLQPFVAFGYTGGSAGTYGLVPPNFSGPIFGFPISTGTATLGPPSSGNSNGSYFPGVGSQIGGILPGVVLQTVNLMSGSTIIGTVPTVFTVNPSYNPDAPLINKIYGDSYLNTHTGGFKWRFNNADDAVGVGVIGAYRWFHDRNENRIGEMFDGASPGGNIGDFMGTFFLDARVGKHVNISANVGYHFNSDIKANIDGSQQKLLNRPDELLLSAAIDFPVNQYFQPIVEVRHTRYILSRTTNAFENHPWDVLAGFRIFPKRWFGFSFAYRRHMNQQDSGSFDNATYSGSATVLCGAVVQPTEGTTPCVSVPVVNNFEGLPPGFLVSENPHGYQAQFFIGRRNPRLGEIINKVADVTGLRLGADTIFLPCEPGSVPRQGSVCRDGSTVTVATTAVDPENDVLTFNYTVSGGRIVGSGANVTWDLSGVGEGTYTIVAGVDDGCGLCGKTETRTVRVVKCDCVKVCECPTVSVTGPAGIINPTQTATFTANVAGGPLVTYNWTVTDGVIESGQGTASIVVRTSMADAGKTITATVNLGGLAEILPACNCPTTASESVPVAPALVAILVDEFGKLPNDDIRGRLDNYFQELANHPNDQGYIINYGTPLQIAARERLIKNHIAFRGFDASRITFVRGPDTGVGPVTKLYRVPPGAPNPDVD